MTGDDILNIWFEICSNKHDNLITIEPDQPFIKIIFDKNIYNPKHYESYVSHLLKRSCQFYLKYRLFLNKDINNLVFSIESIGSYTFKKMIDSYYINDVRMENEEYIDLIKKDL